MKINTTEFIKNLNGQIMKDNDGSGNVIDATIKTAMVNAVLSPVQNELGVDKVKKYELAKKIYETDEVELTPEEVTLIKERVGAVYAPLIVGQVFEVLDV